MRTVLLVSPGAELEVNCMAGTSEEALASETRYEPSFDCEFLTPPLAAFLRDLDDAAGSDFFLLVDAGVFLFFILDFIMISQNICIICAIELKY